MGLSGSSRSEASPTQEKMAKEKSITVIIMCLNSQFTGQISIYINCPGYLFKGTITLGIPLLRVKTDNNTLTQEEGCPHDDVPNWSFPLVM